jgi:hypothetical protein
MSISDYFVFISFSYIFCTVVQVPSSGHYHKILDLLLGIWLGFGRIFEFNYKMEKIFVIQLDHLEVEHRIPSQGALKKLIYYKSRCRNSCEDVFLKNNAFLKSNRQKRQKIKKFLKF